MKKISFFLLSIGIFLIQSCKKEEIGSTATEKMSGEWSVRADALNSDGSLFAEDVYELGHFLLSTYNTADDNTSQMWLDDSDNFWKFKGKVNIDYASLAFSGENVQNVSYDSKFTVLNGKILKGLAHTPSGMVADSIVFEIRFDDEDPATPFDRYRITGYRYTGFVADEDH